FCPSASSAPDHHLLSFPTRRSSDLLVHAQQYRKSFNCRGSRVGCWAQRRRRHACRYNSASASRTAAPVASISCCVCEVEMNPVSDRKSTRLNSSHEWISYAVFCLKK